MNFVTSSSESNIFHVLLKEVLPLRKLDAASRLEGKLFIVEDKIKRRSLCQRWRKAVLSSLFSKVKYIKEERTGKLDDPVFLGKGAVAYDPHVYVDLKPNGQFLELVNSIRDHVKLRRPPTYYVLLCQREPNNRYLLESATNLPLQEYLTEALKKRQIPFRYCDFARMTPREQIDICRGAKVFVSAHGAGNTNLAFTPDGSHILEYNFRRHWYCDPMCDRHYSGQLPFDEDCGGGLTFRPHFHKADYRNLSLLLDRPYLELEADHIEGIRGRNPILRERLFVDGKKLLESIERQQVMFQSDLC